ncbi:hypothetical protein RUM43_008125 [Polyplax serrata]|uniref:PAS domain-containing protein n=2 Tax=Polyplax serrata TaxID=468196 RepID=A0AAN8P6L8_POLSC
MEEEDLVKRGKRENVESWWRVMSEDLVKERQSKVGELEEANINTWKERQPGSCHVIYCSDGFCKMSGFSRAEVIGRPSVCEFLHGPLTSQLAIQSVKQAFTTYVEKHQQILYYRKDGKSVLT